MMVSFRMFLDRTYRPFRSIAEYQQVQHSRWSGSAYPPKGGVEGGSSVVGTWDSRNCMSRVNAIVRVQLAPFACRTCQWVSTVATSTVNQT
jgi:hypothetical protein